jgi:ABC-2 type transport system permease protein
VPRRPAAQAHAFSREPPISFGPGRRTGFLAPGILALAIMSTAFTSHAIATGFERRYGALRRLAHAHAPARGGPFTGRTLADGGRAGGLPVLARG